MEKLAATRGCPGLSYLNTAKRAMAILNIGLSGLALSIDLNIEQLLLSKFLKGTMYVKAAMNSIEKYDTELPLAIAVLERLAQNSNPSLESDSQETSRDEGVSLVDLERRRDQHSNVFSSYESEQAPLNNDSECPYDCARSTNEEENAFGTGKKVRKFFASMGWYIGTVESSREKFDGPKTYTVRFEDGEYEECPNEELACSNEKSRISIGEVGFKFIHNLEGLDTSIRECKFCDR